MSSDTSSSIHGGYVPPGINVEVSGNRPQHSESSIPTVQIINPMIGNIANPPAVTAQPYMQQQSFSPSPQQGGYIAQQQFPIPPGTVTYRTWSTTFTDCLKDEESCWWGTWCCFILSARTTEAFELGFAKDQIYFIIGMGLAVLLLLHFGLVGIVLLLLLGGGLFSAFRRAGVRVGIRHKLVFSGSYFSDFMLHLCCSCCSVCQEAREANQQNVKRLDYCSGQDLSDLVVPDNSPNTTLTIADENPVTSSTSEFSIYPLYFQLSHASQLILKLCGVFFLYISIRLAVLDPTSLGILLLVFVQPIFILYYFYWRSRRKNAQLDYVVKLFAVGFFMATTQSMFFEVILQYAISLAAGIVFYLLNPDYFTSKDSQSNHIAVSSFASSMDKFSTRGNLHWYKPSEEAFGTIHLWYSNDIWTSIFPMDESTVATDDDSINGVQKSIVRQNMLLLLIVLFLFAFVVAAGVEETMKHFTVRCCRFPAPLKDPHAILVYLMSGALGFATAENIEYVFGTKTSPIHGTSLFVGELFVLFLRICMPIHLICSVLQAANLSRVNLGGRQMNIVQVLLPALILHGSFDFFLFAAGAIEYAYDINSLAFDVTTFIFPFVMTVAGICFAKFEFDKVIRDYNSSWQPLQQDDDLSIHHGQQAVV